MDAAARQTDRGACPARAPSGLCAVNIGDGNAYRYREVVQSDKGIRSYHSVGASFDAREQVGPHHQYRVGAWFGGVAIQVSICRCQAWNCRADQSHGTGDCRTNVTCNAICPGYVYTPLVEAQIDGQARAHNIPREKVIRDVLLAQQPNKRFASVEELGALSVFLASDAAGSIMGIALPVDGSWTAY